jgi:hypothetical protein
MPELFVYYQTKFVPLESAQGQAWHQLMRGRHAVIRVSRGRHMMLTLSRGENYSEFEGAFTVI